MESPFPSLSSYINTERGDHRIMKSPSLLVVVLATLLVANANGCCCGEEGEKGVGQCPPPGGCNEDTCGGHCEDIAQIGQRLVRGPRHRRAPVATCAARRIG